MHRILFCGPGYGAGNIGDDAILSGILTSCRMYMPDDTLYGALTHNPDFTKAHTEIDYVWHLKKDSYAAFNWATHIIFGGATLIGRWGISNCSHLIRLAHKMKKPACMVGVGVTDRPSEDQLTILRETFGSLDMITLRSEADKKIAVSYGLLPKRLWVCADCAFAIDCKGISYKPKNTFGINLVHEKLPEKHSYVKTITRFLAESPKDSYFTFICGEARKDSNYDFMLLSNLHKQFQGKFICTHFAYHDFLKILASCRVVLTMRMHMVIFCSLIGVPCIPLVRERKTQLMADALGLSYTLSLDESFTDFKFLVSESLKHPEKALADKNKVKILRKRSFTNGLMIQKWINKIL